MGNIGSIEKVMVFGILVIIVTILGIAFYSATKMDNDLTANQLDASGQDPVVLLDDPGTSSPSRNNTPVVKDVRPNRTSEGTLDNTFKALKNNVHQNEPAGSQQSGGNDRNRSGLRIQHTPGTGDQGANPSGAETHAEKKTVKAEPKYYKVQKGDSFMSIARVLFGDERKFKLLMQANPHVDPMSLQIGQKLIIPNQPDVTQAGSGSKKVETSTPSVAGGEQAGTEYTGTENTGTEYTVKSGDTLASISLAIYGTSKKWKKIYEANRAVISNPDVLSVGDVLTLPQNP